jgi:tRNA dimethylallyltransferase
VPDVIAIVGPTAVGKSSVALDVARTVGGEVVNADSMQLYRGMDVGTAKLTVEERQGIEHHLLDVLDVRDAATVADYQVRARACIDDLRARGVVPVFVGGSGLYLRGALDVLDFPGTDEEVRGELEDELAKVGPAAMHQRLSAVDPDAAASIGPANGRRLVRALEVYAISGRPWSSSPGMTAYVSAYDVTFVGIQPESPTALDDAITRRVDEMWARAFVDEVRALEEAGLREGRTASRALGYGQILRHLAGEITDAQARTETVYATRRYARRQLKWFRRDPRITWVPAERSAVLQAAASD